MLAKRIIPCLDVDAGRVVKGVRFQDLRDAGDPVELAARYDAAGADELVLVVGADAFAQFAQWKEPERIRSLAQIAVLVRGEERGPDAASSGVRLLQTRRVDISSTELRARIAGGRTIRGFVPDAVADYIAEHRLYK